MKEVNVVQEGGRQMRKFLVITLLGALLCAALPGAALAGDRHSGSALAAGLVLGATAAVVGGVLVNAFAPGTRPPRCLCAPPDRVRARAAGGVRRPPRRLPVGPGGDPSPRGARAPLASGTVRAWAWMEPPLTRRAGRGARRTTVEDHGSDRVRIDCGWIRRYAERDGSCERTPRPVPQRVQHEIPEYAAPRGWRADGDAPVRVCHRPAWRVVVWGRRVL